MRTTTAQNAAHRADLTWIKVGRSEYMRADGIVIRKDNRNGFWYIYLPNGAHVQSPNMYAPTGFIQAPAVGFSLTMAKYEAEKITAESPEYVAAKR